MRQHDSGTNLLQQRDQRSGIRRRTVLRAEEPVGHELRQVLIERLDREVGVTQPKPARCQLFITRQQIRQCVRRCIAGPDCGHTFLADRRAAAVGGVDDIHRVVCANEDRVPPFAAVRCGLEALARVTAAGPHHDRHFGPIGRWNHVADVHAAVPDVAGSRRTAAA